MDPSWRPSSRSAGSRRSRNHPLSRDAIEPTSALNAIPGGPRKSIKSARPAAGPVKKRGKRQTKASHGLIAENSITNASINGIEIANSLASHEGPWVTDVEIANNTFTNCATDINADLNESVGIITIRAKWLGGASGHENIDQQLHQDIRIHDNTFTVNSLG